MPYTSGSVTEETDMLSRRRLGVRACKEECRHSNPLAYVRVPGVVTKRQSASPASDVALPDDRDTTEPQFVSTDSK